MNNDEYELIAKIAQRAKEMDVTDHKFGTMMDVGKVHETVGLDLERLLNASDSNFTHDAILPQDDVRMDKKKAKKCFCGRFIQQKTQLCKTCRTKFGVNDVEMYKASKIQPWLSKLWK